MSDKVTYVPDSIKEAVENTGDAFRKGLKRGIKETFAQVFGINASEVKKNQEETKKLAEKAEKSGNTIEEQAKIEALRRQLHQQMIAPQPSAPEQPASKQENQVGTNEQTQPISQPGNLNTNGLPPLAQPSMRQGERLKIRE